MNLNPSLVQIRRSYTSKWSGLALSVEAGAQGWTASVNDPGRHSHLYTAHRFSAEAAKVAAVEFAVLLGIAKESRAPEQLARELTWTSGW